MNIMFSTVILLAAAVINAVPALEFYPGQGSKVAHDNVVRSFYGPWSSIRRPDGQSVDYRDYGVHIRDPYGPNHEYISDSESDIGDVTNGLQTSDEQEGVENSDSRTNESQTRVEQYERDEKRVNQQRQREVERIEKWAKPIFH